MYCDTKRTQQRKKMRLDKEDMKISKISLKGKNFRNLITFTRKKKEKNRRKRDRKSPLLFRPMRQNAFKCFIKSTVKTINSNIEIPWSFEALRESLSTCRGCKNINSINKRTSHQEIISPQKLYNTYFSPVINFKAVVLRDRAADNTSKVKN